MSEWILNCKKFKVGMHLGSVLSHLHFAVEVDVAELVREGMLSELPKDD